MRLLELKAMLSRETAHCKRSSTDLGRKQRMLSFGLREGCVTCCVPVCGDDDLYGAAILVHGLCGDGWFPDRVGARFIYGDALAEGDYFLFDYFV